MLDYNGIERLYGSSMIKVDLWHRENRDPCTSVFVRADGYAGKWFSENPQFNGPYIQEHYSPNDYYNCILPQMVMRHFVNQEEIINDFSNHWIGAH